MRQPSHTCAVSHVLCGGPSVVEVFLVIVHPHLGGSCRVADVAETRSGLRMMANASGFRGSCVKLQRGGGGGSQHSTVCDPTYTS